MANLRWGALDQHILEVVGDALGWGPDRTLCELGGGPGLHSLKLKATGRCGETTIVDPCPEARVLAGRFSHRTLVEQPDELFDVVWSSGLVEHFFGPARQAIVDGHFRLASGTVVLVVPAATWTRELFPPRAEVPDSTLYTATELYKRMTRPGWTVEVSGFAPLFGIRHIPDAFYPVVDRMVGWALPDNLLLGVARCVDTQPQEISPERTYQPPKESS